MKNITDSSACYSGLQRWWNGKQRALRYDKPVIWKHPGQHHEPDKCYFCVNKAHGFTRVNKEYLQYIGTVYAELPVEREPDFVPPIPPSNEEMAEIEAQIGSESIYGAASTSSYEPSYGNFPAQPKLINKQYFNNICRKLYLSQRSSVVLASMLREYGLLAEDVHVYDSLKRQENFIHFFTMEGNLTYCNDIRGLMNELHIAYHSDDWRLFIDSNSKSLKSALLHNDNAFMPIPIAYSTQLKENYDSMEIILNRVNYNEYQWDVIGDLKVTALIMGLQLGNVKNPCFLCVWLPHAKLNHYKSSWEERTVDNLGEMSRKRASLIDRSKMLFPPLHIKLGLVSNFIKAMKKTGRAFLYLSEVFPKLTPAKLRAGNTNISNMYINKKKYEIQTYFPIFL